MPVGVWERDLKKADWELVAQLCQEGLLTRSKDLQLAVWLLETLIFLDGFSGLRQGLQIIFNLSESFWETLYPKIENDSYEHRYGLFHWINNQLVTPIKQIHITQPHDRKVPRYNTLQWEMALQGHNQPRHREQPEVTIVKFNKSMDATPASTLKSAIDDLAKAGDLLLALKQRLDLEAITAVAAPSFQSLTDTLEQIQGIIMKALQNQHPEEQPQDQLGDEENQPPSKPPIVPVRAAMGKINSREDAYRQLDYIADYLMRNEPHSPTPYLLKRIRSWGDMTLFELLGEVASASDEQSRIKELFFLKQNETKH